MRKLIFCLMLGLLVVLAGCGKEEPSDVNNGDGNGSNGGGNNNVLGAISLDHVDGSPADGKLTAGGEAAFYIRLTNNSGFPALGITNGFRIYSTDGATWATSSIDTTGTLTKTQFDLIFTANYFSVTGSGADTVAYGGAKQAGTGMVNGFDDIAYKITIGPIDAASVGKHICLDSSFYPPSGSWMWSYGSDGAGPPAWDGPHCFEVVQ